MASSMNNIGSSLRNNWKPILWGLVPVLILVIIFALPLKIVPVQTTEKYIDTEMRQEPYTVQESYQETEPYLATETKTSTIYDSYVSTGGWSYSFNVNQPGTTVRVSMPGGTYSNPYYYYRPYIFYTDNVTPIPYPPYYFDYWWRDTGYYGRNKITIQISYPEEVTKYRTVTKTRDVIKYREVPVQVEKERVTTSLVQMSIWQYLFLDQRQKANLPEI